MEPVALELESERLFFRNLDDSHFEHYCEMDLDPEVMRFYQRPFGTRELARINMQRYLEYQKTHPRLGAFMAFSKTDRRFVGLGALIHLELDPKNSKVEVGYRLPLREWNKGYATEICRTLLRYGFEELGLPEIFGTIKPENVKSENVFRKCGLTLVGSWENYGGCSAFRISSKH